VHAEGADRGSLGGIAAVDDERAGEIGVELSDGGGGGAAAKLDKHFVRRTFERLAADDGADGDDTFSASAQLFTDTGHGKDRTDADERIAGADDDAVCVADSFEDPGSWMRVLDALEMDRADTGLGAVLDEIFLKMHATVAGLDDGGEGLIGHRKNAGFHAESMTDGIGGLRESFPLSEHDSAMNVRGEIAIAEMEPRFMAVAAESLEKMKCFAAHAPTGGRIHHAGERVRDDVEVGGDFEAVEDDVVASVDDDGEHVGIHRMVEAEEKL